MGEELVRAYEQGWLKAYVAHQRYSESPTSFHFWTGVATIAGALGRKVWIDQRFYQWTPNFYIVLVGPPGVAAKSTSLRAGLSLLEQIEGVTFGPQSMTWQALNEALKAAMTTIEFRGKTIPMSCLTIGASELGTLLRPEDREFLDLLTAMWDGQKETYRRRTKGDGEIVIQNPWLNIIGCTTPSWLRDNFPDVLIGGGLTSRIVFVFAEKKRQLVAYPAQQITSSGYEDEEKALVHDLYQIAQIQGEYQITPEAIEWGTQWYDEHNLGPRPAHVASDRFQGYLARKQTHIHKLAIVLAASKRDTLQITREDLVEACEHTTVLERDMLRVFSSIGVAQGAKVTGEVISLIRNHKSITYQELWKLCLATMAARDFKESVQAAIDAGEVLKVPCGPNNWQLTYTGGRK